MTNQIEYAEIKRVVERHWSSRAAEFDDRPNHGLHSDAQRAAWLEVLRGVAGPAPLRALDAGCGTGFLALLLAELGHQVDGIDISAEMLARARQKAAAAGLAVDFRQGDAEAPDAADATYDLLVERHVLWTLPDPAAALHAWKRVLRPGGQLVLFEGDWQSSGHADYAPIRAALPLYGGRPAADLAALALDAGFARAEAIPLMDAVLWGETPDRARYALRVWRPR